MSIMLGILIAVILIVLALSFSRFYTGTTETQITQIQEWLLYAVTEAESLFGNGTGKIKLSYVYDKFVEKFPWIAKWLSAESFSEYVDTALVTMRNLISTNAAVANLVTGTAEGIKDAEAVADE